ncbi:MAG: hypothetical protein M1819_001606 [Sarea resinae]|nr:MAG: hypothetical protein M1819_001606 [Sarea resinae]
MLTSSSPSPTLQPNASSPAAAFHVRSFSNGSYRPSHSQSPRQHPRPARPSGRFPQQSPLEFANSLPGSPTVTRGSAVPRQTVDAGTQYSPPQHLDTSPSSGASGSFRARGKRRGTSRSPPPPRPEEPLRSSSEAQMPSKRAESEAAAQTGTPAPQVPASLSRTESSPKRPRPPAPAVRVMPTQYENCDVKDLVFLISNMLMELVRYNDEIPLKDGRLTRFHSRAPPTISIPDYLARLTTHATLSPPILLSMVFYIDRLCALYPAFTISSLTVHRFLITSATVASKGLSDSFWTNSTYARVGGVSLKELAMLELEFLWRVEWRIVPKPEVLVDYYQSLVERSEGYTIEGLGVDRTGSTSPR